MPVEEKIERILSLVKKWQKTGLLDKTSAGSLHTAILIEPQQCRLIDEKEVDNT